MPIERSSDVKFEIGHVLFIDIVGYSKLLISEQSELQQTLKASPMEARWVWACRYSCAAPVRSNVRSTSQRSAFPKTRCK
jgi:hypothetical protein